MDIRTKITVIAPQKLMDALGIDENTAFFTTFIDGYLVIEPIDDEELQESGCETLDDLFDNQYEEGVHEYRAEGALEGYYDAMRGNPYNNSYKGRMRNLCKDRSLPKCIHRCEQCSRVNKE